MTQDGPKRYSIENQWRIDHGLPPLPETDEERAEAAAARSRIWDDEWEPELGHEPRDADHADAGGGPSAHVNSTPS